MEKNKIKPIKIDEIEEDSDLYMFKETEGEEEKDILEELDISVVKEKASSAKEEKIVKKEKEKDNKNEDDKMPKKRVVEQKKNIKRNKRKNKIGMFIGVVIIILIAAVILYNVYQSNQGITSAIVVTINDEELTKDEFNKLYSDFSARFPSVDRELVLDQIVNQMLLLQEANKKGISVDEESVDIFINEWLDNIKSSFSEEELKTQLEQQGKTLEEVKEEVRDNYKKSLIINELIEEEVLKKKEILIPEQVRASHILVDTLEEANEILEELKERDFGELASERSIDPSAKSNLGDLGYFGKGQMVKEFEDVAFSLPVGEMSEPVQTQFGYHIIKVEDKKEAQTRTLSDLTPEERNNVLAELQNAVDSYVEELKDRSDIIIFNEVLTEESVKEIVEEEEVEKTEDEIEEEEQEIVEEGGVEEIEEEEVIDSILITPSKDIKTFKDTGEGICTEDGKPVIKLFSTTWCPHCKWISATFDNVVKEYVDNGQIVASHWELDKGEDTLTAEIENGIPESELEIYKKYNPKGGVPTYVFGCKYVRIGNGYEKQNDLQAEEDEFRTVIEELLK